MSKRKNNKKKQRAGSSPSDSSESLPLDESTESVDPANKNTLENPQSPKTTHDVTADDIGDEEKTVDRISSDKTSPDIANQTVDLSNEQAQPTVDLGTKDSEPEAADSPDAKSENSTVDLDITSSASDTASPQSKKTVEGLGDQTFDFGDSGTVEFGEEDIDETSAKATQEGNSDEDGTVDLDDDSRRTAVEDDNATVNIRAKSPTAANIADQTFEFGDEANMTMSFDESEPESDDVDTEENTVDLEDKSGKTPDEKDEEATVETDRTVSIDEKKKKTGSAERTLNRQSDSKSIDDARVKSLWANHIDSDVAPNMSIESIRLPKVAEEFNLNPRIVKRNQQTFHTRRQLDYIVGRQLGAGGMGRVQLAHQVAVDRKVAFKEIQPKLIESYEKNGERAQLETKFLSEAHITASLDHPNIVSIYDLGIDQFNNVFYCMEIVDGKEWEELFDEKTLEENLDILLKVGDGIAYAHSKNVIHRDIKPENVMIGRYSQVLIMDWGLAVDLSKNKPQSLGGTPSYMSPEMVKGPRSAIDARSDIYLLGAVLFHIATGAPPRRARRAAYCIQLASSNHIDQVTDSDVDMKLVEIARKAMATKLDDRYQTVAEFQEAIRRHLSNKQSIEMAKRADAQFDDAVKSGNYETFSTALFGFREARSLWAGNSVARTGEQKTKIAYAESAKEKGDFELGISLLDESIPEDKELAEELWRRKRQKERQAVLVKILSYAAALLVVGFLAYFSITSAALNRQTTQLQEQNSQLDQQNTRLDEQYQELDIQKKQLAVEKETAENLNKQLAGEKTKLANEKKIAVELSEQLSDERDKLASEKAKVIEEKEKVDQLNSQLVVEKNNLANEKAKVVEEKEKVDSLNVQLEKEKVNLKIQTDIAVRSEALALKRLYESNISLADNQIRDNRIGSAVKILNQASESENAAQFIDWEYYRLKHLCHENDVQNFSVPGSPLGISLIDESTAVAVAPDQIYQWDLNSNKLQKLITPAGKISTYTVDQNNHRIYLATTEPVAMTVWDLKRGLQIGSIENAAGKAKSITALAVNQSGTRLLLGNSLGQLRGWNLSKDGSVQEPLTFDYLHSKPISKIAFTKAGDSFASTTGTDGLCLFWNWNSSSVQNAFQNSTAITDIVFSTQTKSYASTVQGEILEIDFARKRTLRELSAENIASNSAASDTLEKVVRFADWKTYTRQPELLQEIKSICLVNSFPAHPSRINAIDIDGTHLITTGEDQQVLIWDLNRLDISKKLRGHNDDVIAAQFAGDGKLVTLGTDGQARYWNSNQYEDERPMFLPASESETQPGQILSIDVSQDRKKTLATDINGNIFVQDNQAGATVQRLAFNDSLGMEAEYLPNSNRLVTSSVNLLKVWENGKQIFATDQIGKSGIFAVSRSEKLLVTGGDDQRPTILWDLEQGKKLAEFLPVIEGRHRVTALALSPDDRYLAVGTGLVEGLLFVFDLRSRKLLGMKERHRGWISDIVFTDSNSLFSADALEEYVNVWKVDDQQTDDKKVEFKVRIDEGLGAYIKVASTRDGTRLITASMKTNLTEDGRVKSPSTTVKVWDAKSLEFLDRKDLQSLLQFLDTHVDDRLVYQQTNGKTESAKLSKSGVLKTESVQFASNSNQRLNGWKKYEDTNLLFGDGYVTLLKNGQPVQAVGNNSACRTAAFVQNDTRILAFYDVGLVRLWNLQTGEVEKVLQSDGTQSFQKMAVDPSAHQFAVYNGSELKVLSCDSFDQKCKLAISDVQSLQWIEPTKLLLTTLTETRIVDAGTGKSIDSIKLEKPPTLAVGSDNGKTIVTLTPQNDQQLMQLWKKDDQGKWQLRGTEKTATTTATLSANGKRIFTGDNAGNVTVWDSAGQNENSPLRPMLIMGRHPNRLTAIHFDAKQGTLISASEKGEVTAWLTDQPDRQTAGNTPSQ